jgi:rod shape determining protein RodA
LVAVLIAVLGIISIYSSTYQKDDRSWQLIYQRQMLWVFLGLVIFAIVSNVNYRRLLDMNYFLYGAVLFLLFLVFALGVVRLGAQRWIKFGWFNFQPSEIAKLAIVIFIAGYYSMKSAGSLSLGTRQLGVMRGFIKPFIFVAIPMGLIIEQPDLGSGLIVFFIFLAMVYAAGVRLRYIIIFFLLMALISPVFWHFLREYQRQRLMVFINPNVDPLGAGYTIIQSKIAIGSGGFFGKGWLSGTQSQLHFLPESHTDFIFATFAEEHGIVGCVVLLALYYILIRQGIRIAMSTGDQFARLLAMGISLMLGIQVSVNIAMNSGLAPVVGLPLPLMSYGGSSVIVTFIALGILVSIEKQRTVF